MPRYVDENGNPASSARIVPDTFNGDTQDAIATATGAASSMTPTLAAIAGRTNFITGFMVDGLGATAASVIEVTITGLVGGNTLRRKVNIPAGATSAITPVQVDFARPIPASAPNTAIVLTVPSFGAGNTSAVSALFGFSRYGG